MKGKELDLTYYIREALFHDKLMFVCVTSSAKGMIEGEGFFYGEGKSNLAMGLSETCYKTVYPDKSQEEINELVKMNMGYDDRDVMDMVIRGSQARIACWVSDDMEVCFGKHRSYDNKFRELAYFMQTIRPYLGIFIGTMPDLGQVASAWRELFMFEIKVPFRGYCEIQKIKRWTDFGDPLDPRSRLEYHGEQEFPKANKALQEWYIPWRNQRVMEYHDLLTQKYYPKPKQPIPLPEQSQASQAAKIMSLKGVAARRANRERLKQYDEAAAIKNP